MDVLSRSDAKSQVLNFDLRSKLTHLNENFGLPKRVEMMAKGSRVNFDHQDAAFQTSHACLRSHIISHDSNPGRSCGVHLSLPRSSWASKDALEEVTDGAWIVHAVLTVTGITTYRKFSSPSTIEGVSRPES